MKHEEHYNYALAVLIKKAMSNDFKEVLAAINRLEGIADTVFCYEELYSKRHSEIEKVIKTAHEHMLNLTEKPLTEHCKKQACNCY